MLFTEWFAELADILHHSHFHKCNVISNTQKVFGEEFGWEIRRTPMWDKYNLKTGEQKAGERGQWL